MIFYYRIDTILLLLFFFGGFFFFFFCLILQPGLPVSGKSGHPCLFPDHGKKTFNLSPLSMMLAVDMSTYMPPMAFIMLCSFYT